jgi:hypothetical protein
MFAKLSLALVAAGALFAQGTDYSGPSILSRGSLPGGQEEGLFDIRPFAGVSGIYDSALTGVSVNSQGQVPSAGGYGVEAHAGVEGYHTWQESSLSLDYSMSARHYTNESYYDGINESLALSYTRRLSRRLQLRVQEAGGISNNDSMGIASNGDYVNPQLANIPTNELFDTRVYYQSTYATLTYRLTKRWSISGGGNEFVAERPSPDLISAHGYGAYGDVGYRLNKTSTVTAFYNFNHFAYAQSFGATDFHMVGIGFAKDFGRNWHLYVSGGGARVETLGLELVPIDPAVAAIIGQSSGVVVAYHLNYVPSVQASLVRRFHRSSLAANYSEGMSPGNGVYLTSRSRVAGASYNYAASRKWSATARVGYTSLSDMTRTIGGYSGIDGGVSGSYRLVRSFFFTADGDIRDQNAGVSYARRANRVSAGITWSPGEFPVSFR